MKGPGFVTNVLNQCSCSSQLRPLPGGKEPVPQHGFGNLTRCREEAQHLPKAPAKAKNVLYVLIDDLRPEMTAYGRSQVYTPNIQRLANSGMVFDNAYCQIAVCSPSRVSFLSGRRPDTSGTVNFVNHFRQAHCPSEKIMPLEAYVGTPLRTFYVDSGKGGAGECCSQCTAASDCKYWTWNSKNCTQYASVTGTTPANTTISGPTGNFDFSELTSLPENFKKNGYLTASSGKIFHTEQGGRIKGTTEMGMGMPPNEDPESWTPGCSMDIVNLVADNHACKANDRSGVPGCAVDATKEGDLNDPDEVEFCDKTIADQALKKLSIAANRSLLSGRPFFLAVGLRKPHMPWRFPKPYLDVLPALEKTKTALHPTMDPSMPPIAHHTPDLQADPFNFPSAAFNLTSSRAAKLYYHAATAWTDFQLGRVLDALDATGMADDTLVVLHSDHGWALGEHGQWQKFTNWEVGVRAPLIIRAPWLPQSAGKRSSALVELVDMYKTQADLAGISLPKGEKIDGTSLGPIMRAGGNASVRTAALSQFARCPKQNGNNKNFGPWSTDPKTFWKDNWCELVDRSMIPWMGYSMRTDRWRYTEWAAWDGKKLKPDWSKPLAGRELYDHEGDDGTDYDAFENKNLAEDPKYKKIVKQLSSQLHDLVAKPDNTLYI